MRTIIGVMGGSLATPETTSHAEELGRLIAGREWVVLSGGRDAGVMAAVSRGASSAGGLVIGILPGDSADGASPHLDIAIPTGLGDARNAVNVLASDVVIALRGGAGTISEVALALKAGKRVVMLDFHLGSAFDAYYDGGMLFDVSSPHECVELVQRLLAPRLA